MRLEHQPKFFSLAASLGLLYLPRELLVSRCEFEKVFSPMLGADLCQAATFLRPIGIRLPAQ
jgi:hypothetical protein